MPHLKPHHLSTSVYDEIKGILREHMNWKDKPPKNAEHIIVSNLLRLIQKEQTHLTTAEKY